MEAAAADSIAAAVIERIDAASSLETPWPEASNGTTPPGPNGGANGMLGENTPPASKERPNPAKELMPDAIARR